MLDNERGNIETVEIDSDYIRLDALLKLGGAAVTGGQAKLLIQEGDVIVNGKSCTLRGKKMRDGDEAIVDGKIYRVSAR